MTHSTFDIQQALAPGGIISKSLPGFESRPQQLQMASAVHERLAAGEHLAVEAGTGVGKSFGYLIPIIELVSRTAAKALISTFTITLQEQLINKDIPFLTDSLPQQFTAELAKGRGNYLCKRRLQFTRRNQTMLFHRLNSQLQMISDWAGRTKDGSLSDIPFLPDNQIWDKVKSEHGNCRGRKCPHFQQCFYFRAKRRMQSADIIVANHALLFSDLVIKDCGASLLPDYKFVIIDEAHNIEHVAEQHFGINISNYRIRFFLDGLYNPKTHKGLLAYKNQPGTIEIIRRTYREAETFFNNIRNWHQKAEQQTNGRCYKNFIDDNISGHLNKLAKELAGLIKKTDEVDEKFEIDRYRDRCDGLVQDLDCFLLQKKIDCVYWIEPEGNSKKTIRLRSAPLNVGPDVKKVLWDKYDSIVLTSATLSTERAGQKSGFDFFASRIGLEDFQSFKLGSPFDYQKHVTLYVEKGLPNPNDPAFIEAASKAIKKYIKKTKARAFVLFTSYAMLQETAGQVSKWLAENNIQLLQQGLVVDRTTLLKQFKTQKSAVLFGTDSFWQGVDVPGEALSNVIIVRLPFAVPDQPLIAGRLEQISQNGGNPFLQYQLPSAIMKFKQGFGRLIRTKTDSGIVAVLDSRIVNKSYGQQFLDAIPDCKIQLVPKQQ